MIIINSCLVKDSFRQPTVKVKPFGFLAKTFFFQLNFLVVKNFLPETLTLPGQPAKWPSAPHLLFCCLSKSLSHPLNFIYPKKIILYAQKTLSFLYEKLKSFIGKGCENLSFRLVKSGITFKRSTRLKF